MTLEVGAVRLSQRPADLLLCDAVRSLLSLSHGFTDGRGLLAADVRPVHTARSETQTQDRTEDRGFHLQGLLCVTVLLSMHHVSAATGTAVDQLMTQHSAVQP